MNNHDTNDLTPEIQGDPPTTVPNECAPVIGEGAPARSQLSLFVSQYCGPYYGISDQREGEPDRAFQRRVAGLLRSRGKLIEAHEAMQGARWDDPHKGAGVIDGIAGAAAIAHAGASYGANGFQFGDEAERGERIVGDERIAGEYLRYKQEHSDPPIEAFLMAMQLFDRR